MAFRYITAKEPCQLESHASGRLPIALCWLCAKVDGREMGGLEAAERGVRQASMEAQVAGAHPGDLPHAMFNWRARLFSVEKAVPAELAQHAPGVCKHCSTCLDTGRMKPFWVCCPGSHGRQCYQQHLHVALCM